MKPNATLAIAIIALLVSTILGCDLGQEPRKDHFTNKTGKVESWSNIFVIIPDDTQIPRLSPENLQEQYRKDGLRVLYSGNYGYIDPSVGYLAIPFRLTRIEVIE